MLPLNHNYLPNLAKNIWAPLQDPFYDRGARYTVPYVVWCDGIGWRNDKIGEGHRRDEGAVGHLLGVEALDGQGRDARRLARRARDADAARRDAQGRASRTSTPRTRRSSRRPAATSRSSRRIATSRSTITDYQTLPEGKSWLHHSWSGDLLAAALLLPAEGHARPTCSRSGGPTQGGVVQNDLLCILAESQEAGARARVPQLHARRRRTRTTTSCSSTATRRRRTTIDARRAGQGRADPEDARDRASLRPDQFANNQELLALSVEGSQPLAERLVEVQGRLSGARWIWRVLALPGRRLAVGLLPGRALRGALRRARQPEHARASRCRSGTRSTGTSAT